MTYLYYKLIPKLSFTLMPAGPEPGGLVENSKFCGKYHKLLFLAKFQYHNVIVSILNTTILAYSIHLFRHVITDFNHYMMIPINQIINPLFICGRLSSLNKIANVIYAKFNSKTNTFLNQIHRKRVEARRMNNITGKDIVWLFK